MLRACAASALAASLLASCAPGSDPSDDEPVAAAPTERDEDAYIDAVHDARPHHGMPGAPTDREWIRWGDLWCEASRIQWRETNTLEHGQSTFALERHIPERHQMQVLGLSQEAWTYLCPELDPDNVPDGEKPAGID